VLLDGWHNNEQLLLDYKGVQPYLADECVIYLHDVDLCNMNESYDILKQNTNGFSCFDVDYSTFGCKALVRGFPKVKEWLELTRESPIERHRNPKPTLGASTDNHTDRTSSGT
jgi:hypothetical protein